MEEVKRLLKTANEIIKNQQIQSEEKEMVENITRLYFLTGAYEMCLILEKENIAKELKTIINQISDKL